MALVYIAWNWHADVPVSELAARWAPAPSKFVGLDGMQVHVRDEGPRADRLPIVLLHGTSASLHTWDGWAAALKAQHRVIRLDLPAFGLTGPFPDSDYRTAHYVSFVRDFLKQMGVAHCVIAGNSFGGELAWQTALADPERVRALVLVDSAGYPVNSRDVPIGFRLARLPYVNQLLQNVLPRAVIRSSVRNVYGDPQRVTEALIDRYFELTLRAGNRRALVEHFAVYVSGADSAHIGQVRVPTLIVWGGRDRLIPPDSAQQFARDIAGSRLVMFAELGHVPQEEDPAQTLVPVTSFLEEQRRALAATQ